MMLVITEAPTTVLQPWRFALRSRQPSSSDSEEESDSMAQKGKCDQRTPKRLGPDSGAPILIAEVGPPQKMKIDSKFCFTVSEATGLDMALIWF